MLAEGGALVCALGEGLLFDGVAVDGVEEIFHELTERDAAHLLGDGVFLQRGEFLVDTGKAAGEGGNGVGIARTHDDLHGEVFEGDGGPGDGRAAGGLEGFGDADGVDDDVVGFPGLSGGGDFAQAVEVEGAGAAALHLLEVALGLHVAHEEQAFERFYVGAGGDHVHGDGNARVVAVAKLGKDGLGGLGLLNVVVLDVALLVIGGVEGDALDALAGAEGDLFAEGVSFAELLADDVDDVVGVRIGLGEDEGFGDLVGAGGVGAVGENLGHAIAEGADDGANLRGVDDVAVEFFGGVGLILVLLGPAFGAGEFFAFFDEAFEDGAALLGDGGFDGVDLALDIHAIGDGVLVSVFGDDVLAEEAVGAAVGCGGEADEEGLEVVEDLAPEVVDRAVALIDDDEIEKLGRDLGVVGDGERFAFAVGGVLGGVLVLSGCVEFGALENRIHPLNGGDADLRIGGDVGRGEALGGVELGELAVVVVGREGEELLLGLLAEIAGIDQEEHAADAGVLEQAIDGRDGGEGFSRAGGHLDERARAGVLERDFKICDGLDLALAEMGRVERWEIVEAGTEGATGGEKFAEGLGAMEGEDLAGAGLGIALIGEAGDDAGGLVEEGQRHTGGLNPLQLGGGVVGGLVLGDGDVGAEGFLLGLGDADRLAVDEQHVVGGAGVGGVFADGLALAGVEIDGVLRLHDPTGGPELRVDGVAGDLFGGLVGRHCGVTRTVREERANAGGLQVANRRNEVSGANQRLRPRSGMKLVESQELSPECSVFRAATRVLACEIEVHRFALISAHGTQLCFLTLYSG